MKKRTKIILVLCALLVVAILIGIVVLDRLYWAGYFMDDYYFYEIDYDLSAAEASDAAYLLDPDFTITADHFSDCIQDYFAAPSILDYSFVQWFRTRHHLMQDDHAIAFADAFRDVSVTEIAEVPTPEDYDYTFENAIGRIAIWENRQTIYIHLDFQNDMTFCTSEQSLISELKQICTSLKEHSEEAPRNTDWPH